MSLIVVKTSCQHHYNRKYYTTDSVSDWCLTPCSEHHFNNKKYYSVTTVPENEWCLTPSEIISTNNATPILMPWQE